MSAASENASTHFFDKTLCFESVELAACETKKENTVVSWKKKNNEIPFFSSLFVTMTHGCSRCTSSAMQVLTLTKPTKEAPLSEHHALHLNFIFSNDSSHDFERLRFSEILLMGDTHVPEKQEKQLNHVPKIQVKLVHFFGLCTKQLF